MMDRLTFDGNFCDIAQCAEIPCRCGLNCSQKQVWERLKAYENTGMEPDEIKRMKRKSKPLQVKKIEVTYGSPYACPRCEAELIPVEFMCYDGSEPEEKVSYCWKCGGALDWEGVG